MMMVPRRSVTTMGAMIGVLAAAGAVGACGGQGAAPGAGTTGATAPDRVREVVETDPPDLSGLDLSHVSPDPTHVEGTVLSTRVDPARSQSLFLWEEGNAPTTTQSAGWSGYDPAGFRPTVTSVPAARGVSTRGAVLLCAGGAFALRGDNSDCYPTAELDPQVLSGAVPTYYCYGTRDPFYDQFEAQVGVVHSAGRRFTSAS